MGFFDALKKIAGAAAKEIGEAVTDAIENSDNSKTNNNTTANTPSNSTPADILASGNTPAKPSIERTAEFFGGETGDDMFEVKFMLSGDFIEFDSKCELCPSYQYEPCNSEDYIEYKKGYPCIFFGDPKVICNAVREYHNNGTVGRDFNKIENDTYLFAATVDYCGDNLRFYAFSGNTVNGECFAIALQYGKDLEGTALERKLIAALDEAAASYKENKV